MRIIKNFAKARKDTSKADELLSQFNFDGDVVYVQNANFYLAKKTGNIAYVRPQSSMEWSKIQVGDWEIGTVFTGMILPRKATKEESFECFCWHFQKLLNIYNDLIKSRKIAGKLYMLVNSDGGIISTNTNITPEGWFRIRFAFVEE